MDRLRWLSVPLLASPFLLSLMAGPGAQISAPPGPQISAPPGAQISAPPGALGPGSDPHTAEVMKSSFCAKCHPAIYAEHEQNTHGRAFSDPEVRLATGHFDQGDCIRCHTPRPIFETGIGMNPVRRYYDLEEGNSCMTCHWKPGQDYSHFEGGAECKTAFDPRVGTVEACASCHRNHGTPYQWATAPTGKLAHRKCITCHMATVKRPVAVGMPPTRVRSHIFPASRNAKHLHRAYRYSVRIEGNHAIARIENKGAGHNFPTELKQRSVESLVIVRDDKGAEVSRSRMVFRDPYKRPYGLRLPVNTQIPAGQAREHVVPIKVASGTVDFELHFKLYYPIEDYHPDLSRRLELRRLSFHDVTPSDEKVDPTPAVVVKTPESIPAEAASPAQLVDYSHPKIGTVEIDVPQGNSPEDIKRLIQLFQFPVPEGNARAQERLAEIGEKAVPALIEALGSWDNKTYTQAQGVLVKIGDAATPAVLQALTSDQLFVRRHARRLVPRMSWRDDQRPALVEALRKGLESPLPLDRSSSALALGEARAHEAAGALRGLLTDADPDVVRCAAVALARLDDRDSIPALEMALGRAHFVEIRRELAEALATLGSTTGIPELLGGLDYRDDLLREKSFESLFAVTGLYMGYDPMARRQDRLPAIARLQSFWAQNGSPDLLRLPPRTDARTQAHAWKLVTALGGGTGMEPGGDDVAIMQELEAMGEPAVPALVLGLKFPPGFAAKRARICEVLGRIRNKNAAPALVATLRDPVVAVAAWACTALETCGDSNALPALLRYRDRLLSLAHAGQLPAEVGPVDSLLAQVARVQLLLGDDDAKNDLVPLLLSDNASARSQAIGALEARFGERRGYDPKAPLEQRRAAAARW